MGPFLKSYWVAIATQLGVAMVTTHPQEVSQLELEMHLQAFHSVDTSQLDWTRPISGQVGVAPHPRFNV